jgi:hypothetical protein
VREDREIGGDDVEIGTGAEFGTEEVSDGATAVIIANAGEDLRAGKGHIETRNASFYSK